MLIMHVTASSTDLEVACFLYGLALAVSPQGNLICFPGEVSY